MTTKKKNPSWLKILSRNRESNKNVFENLLWIEERKKNRFLSFYEETLSSNEDWMGNEGATDQEIEPLLR